MKTKTGDLYAAQATSASTTGCQFVTLARVAVGDPVSVSFRSPSVPLSPGRVVRARRVGDFSVVAVSFDPELPATALLEQFEARESEQAADVGSLF